MRESRQRICLCMIVKDEAAVIERCLQSVQPLIDHWVIVDTGSTDSTRELISQQLAHLPGLLGERPWQDFASNRNQALALAREFLKTQSTQGGAANRDYLLLIDADEALELPTNFQLPPLSQPAYDFQMRYGDLSYARTSLIAADVDWAYVGVLHEYLQCAQQAVPTLLPGLSVRVRAEGARSRNPRKFHDDAALLEAALKRDPDNSRDQFYLAQSYRDAGETDAALSAYQRRAAMPGWDEERWYALLQVALLTERLHGESQPAAVLDAYQQAYQTRPSRAETLVEQARWHRLRSEFPAALLCARAAAQIPLTDDRLFIDLACYGWRALDEWSIAAWYCGCLAEGAEVMQRLLRLPPPSGELPRVRANLGFYQSRGFALEVDVSGVDSA